MSVTTRPSKSVLGAAWAFPVMVAGQFALLAGIPVAIVLACTAGSRATRWWSGLMAAAYAVPLAAWLIGPSTAPSLSKFLGPVATGAVVVAGVAAAAGLRRRPVDTAPRATS
ncbi:hypothetical protein [Amycolatopsis sp. NPDC004378]